MFHVKQLIFLITHSEFLQFVSRGTDWVPLSNFDEYIVSRGTQESRKL